VGAYFEFVDLSLELCGLIGDVLDEGEAQFVFEIGLPELLVVVDIRLEIWIDEFLDGEVRYPCSIGFESALIFAADPAGGSHCPHLLYAQTQLLLHLGEVVLIAFVSAL
jgi:hypothetical protein